VLSLAKLALLASDEQPHTAEKEVCTLNTELDLVLYQEELPDVVLSSYGYDIERMRVLTPTELIKVRGQVFLDVRSLDPLKSLDLIMLACGVPMT
jgi:nuclear pore complex protein Nup133